MKYVLLKTNREVKIGDTVEIVKNLDTAYGTGKLTVKVKITEDTLKKLIEDGFIVPVEQKAWSIGSEYPDNIKPYLLKLARERNVELPRFLIILIHVAKISRRAHLDILIEAMAKNHNEVKRPKEGYWYLDPCVGYKPVQYIGGKSKGAIVFKDLKGAEAAYNLLTPFIKAIVDEEKPKFQN